MPSLIRLGVSDLIAFLPDNAERVLASRFHRQHDLMALDGNTHEVITPWSHMPNLIQLVQGTGQVLPTCDDPVHGRDPGEIVFRHMSVVQRGVRSRELPPPQPETACLGHVPSLMAYNETGPRISRSS